MKVMYKQEKNTKSWMKIIQGEKNIQRTPAKN